MTIEEADTFVRENPGAVVVVRRTVAKYHGPILYGSLVADIHDEHRQLLGTVRLPEGQGKHRAVTA